MKLIERDDDEIEDNEIYMVFAVRLFEPQSQGGAITLSTKDRCIVQISNEDNCKR